MVNYNIKTDSYKFNKNQVDFFINVALVVTRKCNLACRHCCEEPNSKDSSLNNFKKIVDKLAQKKIKKICITGGEPLLRKDTAELLKYIYDKKINITFSTNGSLLNKENLSDIKKFIHNIRFSIYGNQKNHDLVTQRPGSFKKIIECVKLSEKFKIPTSLIMVVMNSNLKDVASVIKICEKHKIQKLYLFSLMPTGRGQKIYPTEYVEPKKIRNHLNKLGKTKVIIKIVDWNLDGQCILIYGNGNVVAQPSYQDIDNKKIVGNLLKETPTKIWNKYPFKTNHINYYLNSH